MMSGLDLPKFSKKKTATDLNEKLIELGKTKQRLADLEEELRREGKNKEAVQTQQQLDYDNAGLPVDSISKKAAAFEVLKQVKTIKMLGISAIVGVFLILLASTFSAIAGFVIAFLMIVPAAIYVNKSQKEIVRLTKDYNL